MSKSSIASFRHKTIQSRATLYILAVVDSSAFARIRGVNVHMQKTSSRAVVCKFGKFRLAGSNLGRVN